MKSTILKLTTITILSPRFRRDRNIARRTPTPTLRPRNINPSADKFYGPITAVDTNAMTFTVNDQTFTVTSQNQMTLAKDGTTVTLADAVVANARPRHLYEGRGRQTECAQGAVWQEKGRQGGRRQDGRQKENGDGRG